MATQTASKATLYGLLFPNLPISPQKHQARPTFNFFQVPGKPHLSPSFVRPPCLTDAVSHLVSFCTGTNNVLTLLLSSLSASLNLSPENSLCNLHRADMASPDIVRLLHYLPQPPSETGDPQTPHTDLGSLTLLFTGSPGLQVLAPRRNQWEFVMPKPNCAVVNVGDGMYLSARLDLAIRFPKYA